MPRLCWNANASGRYVIDVMLGGLIFKVMIDTGVVSTNISGGVPMGFELDRADFDLLHHAGRLSAHRKVLRRDASGHQIWIDSAETASQLFDQNARSAAGPTVRMRLSRGMPGVISRVGAEFFHHLTACRVHWDLDAREWCVEYP